MTTIAYDIVYGNDKVTGLEIEHCFGKLKHLEEQAEWSDRIRSPKANGGVKFIRYFMEAKYDNYDAALAWYEYLLSTKIFGGLVLGTKEYRAVDMLENGINVSTRGRPYHMLNTLSMYRHAYTHYRQVEIFHLLLQAGVNKHMAAIAGCLLDTVSNSEITTLKHEDSEHTAVCHNTFTPRDYQRYVAMAEGTKKVPTSRHDQKESYRVKPEYRAGGVATWLTYTDDRDKHKGKELLGNLLLEQAYTIRYDKEKKEVVDIVPVALSIDKRDTHAVALLATRLNKLHDELINDVV